MSKIIACLAVWCVVSLSCNKTPDETPIAYYAYPTEDRQPPIDNSEEIEFKESKSIDFMAKSTPLRITDNLKIEIVSKSHALNLSVKDLKIFRGYYWKKLKKTNLRISQFATQDKIQAPPLSTRTDDFDQTLSLIHI